MTVPDLGAAVRQSLPIMQRQADSMMWDTVRIVARDGSLADLDPDSYDVDPNEQPVYGGTNGDKAKVKPMARVTGNDVQAGQTTDDRARLVVSVPIAVVDVRPGHIVQVVSSTTDPSLNGEELVVDDVEQGTQLTARRLTCYVDRRRT